jgi:hypothetical protein
MNWEPVLTDLFSEFPVVAYAAAWDATSFSRLCAVPVVAGVACLDTVQLRRTALVRWTERNILLDYALLLCSYFMTGSLPPISLAWCQAPWDPRLESPPLNTCGYNPYVTSSLTRGWVCCLQLLLTLTSAVILGSKSCMTHDHILLSHIWDSPSLEG